MLGQDKDDTQFQKELTFGRSHTTLFPQNLDLQGGLP